MLIAEDLLTLTFCRADNDPLNKTDPLGLRPGDGDLTYYDPCSHLALEDGEEAGLYRRTGLQVDDGACGYLEFIGPARLGANPAEWAHCKALSNSWDCYQAQLARRAAEEEAARFWGENYTSLVRHYSYGRYDTWYGGTPPDGSPGNAFQHMFWNGLMVFSLGEQKAKEFADRHETTPIGSANPDQFYMHRQMDFANNHYGREIGSRVADEGKAGRRQRLRDRITEFVTAELACGRHPSEREGGELVWDGGFVDPSRCGFR